MLLKTRKLFSEFHSQPKKNQFQYSHIPSSVSIYLQKRKKKKKMFSIENMKIFYAEINGA